MINRNKVKEVLDDCEAALAPVAEKHGLTLKRKSCRFTSTDMPVAFKLESSVTRGDSELTKEETDYVDNAGRWGMDHIKLGDQVTVGKKTYRISGARSRANKYPIVVKDEKGKRFKLDLQTAKFGWRCALGDL